MYYKLFRRSHGELTSLLAYGLAEVTYREGEENRPPEWLKEQGYGLLAFRTLEDAEEFYNHMLLNEPDETECWEVEGEEIARMSCCFLSYLENGILYPDDTRTWPEGTVMLKSCRLVKRIWRKTLESEPGGYTPRKRRAGGKAGQEQEGGRDSFEEVK